MTKSSDPPIPNPTVAVNPNNESLAALSAVDLAGPIAMLNLLRFDGEAGRVAYARYAKVAVKAIAAVGGALMYHGQVTERSDWDSIAVVFYPSTSAYLTMQTDPNYVGAIAVRTAGLAARLLYPFALPTVSADEAAGIVPKQEGGVVEMELIRWKDVNQIFDNRRELGSAENGRLPAVGSGLVTDGRWDELRVRQHSSSDRPLAPSFEPDTDIAAIEVIASEPVVPS